MWHAGVAGTNLIVCMSVYNKFMLEEYKLCVTLCTHCHICGLFGGVVMALLACLKLQYRKIADTLIVRTPQL